MNLSSPAILRYHVKRENIPAIDPFALLRGLRGQPRWLWITPRRTLLGWGTAAALQGETASEIARQLASLPPELAALPLFGGLTFDPARPSAPEWAAFPAAAFILPRALYRLESGHATLTWISPTPDAPAPDLPQTPLETGLPTAQPRQPLSRAEWDAMLAAAQAAMSRGTLEKVVLSRTRALDFSAPPPAETIFRRLAMANPSTFRFFFEPAPGHVFLGASPELLAAAEGQRLRTMALAGSAPRGRTLAEDADLREQVLFSAKNRREHAVVVRHIAATLRGIGLQPEHPDQPRVRLLTTVQHLETPIRARLTGTVTLLNAAAALHPTPALAGMPREAALAFIRQHEPHARGWYGAPVGWVSAAGGELAVAIRSALLRGTSLRLYAGAGIMPDSDPQAEWEETALKFRPLEQACEHA